MSQLQKTMNILRRGKKPAFSRPLGGGRPWFPSKSALHDACTAILDRQWYTNQGPLAQELERRIEGMLGVQHAICVTSASIGLLMAAEVHAQPGSGIVISAAARPAAYESLSWTNRTAVCCDIDPDTLIPNRSQLWARTPRSVETVRGVLAARPWGTPGDTEGMMAEAARLRVPIWFDSSDCFGVTLPNARPVGSAGSCEVFSFGRNRMITATEGGCITTNDDDLAARLRNIRSSYGAGRQVAVHRTANGRMSELQAAVALLSLDDWEANRSHAAETRTAYTTGLSGIGVIRQLDTDAGRPGQSYHHIIRLEDPEGRISAPTLLRGLRAENIVARRILDPERVLERERRSEEAPLPGARAAAASAIALPVGTGVRVEDAKRVCDVIHRLLSKTPDPLTQAEKV
jgi:dTDP-4-amino-4,6-dideoxygalactose transaminase